MSRFLYLNIYSFLILLAGILSLALPFYLISKWILIIQAVIAVWLFLMAARLFSSYESKKKELDILVKRNQAEFRPDTFEIFMQAPCGRLLVREVLRELNKKDEFKNLLKLKKPFFEMIRNNCTPSKTVIYINEDAE